MPIGKPPGESDPPLLFQSWPRQRLLAALAHRGPLRWMDAMELSKWAHPQPQQYENFLATGLIVVYGPPNARAFALNPDYPAAAQLKTLIRTLVPAPTGMPRLTLPELEPVGAPVSRVGPRDMFGWWYQTAAILAVATRGGWLGHEDVNDALRLLGCIAGKRRHALSMCEQRRVLEVDVAGVGIHPSFPARAELVAFAQAFADLRPEYDLRPKIVPPPQPNPTPARGYAWARGEVGGDDRPAGVRAALDGTPILFGSVARYRLLATLAVHGSVGATMLQAAARVRSETYLKMMSEGWLARCPVPGRQIASWAVAIAPDLPARAELVALLQRLHERWPTSPTEPLTVVPTTAQKRVRVERYFGSQVRSETLLTLAVLGSADVSMLERAVTSSDRGRIRHGLAMLEHFGIVREGSREGNAIMYELDPTWFAASELRALLNVLIETEKRYEARRASSEPQMSHKRKKMRENAGQSLRERRKVRDRAKGKKKRDGHE